jgi:hypothetical protein
MALVLALQEGGDRIATAAPVEPQQHVIVAVKDRNAFR